ncbi:hypothetical protein [Streptomyces sp. NPDC058280]|uniref:hypothetical protein n=1 Tax=Streptomyces sp. NPDC058280 TaxID=3346419 RepID=UPI0036E38D87
MMARGVGMAVPVLFLAACVVLVVLLVQEEHRVRRQKARAAELAARPIEPRHTASTITDDALDRLYARIVTLEHVAKGNRRHVQHLVPELERAEAAIERAQKLVTQWSVLRAYGSAATELRAALAAEQQGDTP